MGLVNNQKPKVYCSPNLELNSFRLSENLNLRKNVNNFLRSTSKMIENDDNIFSVEAITKEMELLHLQTGNEKSLVKLGSIKFYRWNDQDTKVRVIERDPENARSKVH